MESELISRRTPYSASAEHAVLGAMLIDPLRCVPEVIGLLSAEDFYIPENRKVFETIFNMFSLNRPIDPVILVDELQQLGYYDEIGGQAYIAQLLEVTPTSVNMHEYAAIVKDKSTLRKLADLTGDIYRRIMSGESDTSSLIEAAEQGIYNLRYNSTGSGLVHISTVVRNTYSHLEIIEQNGGKLPGITSGFADLDRVLTGFNNSDLIIVAARPGVGKTSFVMNVALNAARSEPNKKIAVFSLEMAREQLAMRLLSSQALVDFKRLRTCTLDSDEWEKVAASTQIISSTPIYIDDTPDTTPSEIKAKCRRLGDNLGMVVIDYLQLLKSGKNIDNRVQEVGEISRSLKIMAKELNVPVICCAQLSRAVESREDKRPRLSDLRDSGAIEQDADIILFLGHPPEKDPDYMNKIECSVSKNRHGETALVVFDWIGKFFRFITPEMRFGDSAAPVPKVGDGTK